MSKIINNLEKLFQVVENTENKINEYQKIKAPQIKEFFQQNPDIVALLSEDVKSKLYDSTKK